MRMQTVIKIALIFLCIGVFCYSAINWRKGEVYNVSVDMGTPVSVVWPFEIAVVGNKGEKGLRIGPMVGRGWKGEAGGEASYRFYIPQSGQYNIWAYALWYDSCTNAIFAKVGNMEKFIIGNDPIYNQWHWVRSINLQLKKGTHDLYLSNHSDNVALQKIFFTDSATLKPSEADIIFSDIFYDGFDGCSQGNFSQWRQIYGTWEVYNPFEAGNPAGNVLVGSSSTNALIMLDGSKQTDYSVNVSVQSIGLKNRNTSISICFGVEDSANCYLLKWVYTGDGENTRANLIRRKSGREEILSNFSMPWTEGNWHEIQIDLGSKQIGIHFDEERSISIPIGTKIKGGIALGLEGDITSYFDNVHVRMIEK